MDPDPETAHQTKKLSSFKSRMFSLGGGHRLLLVIGNIFMNIFGEKAFNLFVNLIN
jgi:hypothetical protein